MLARKLYNLKPFWFTGFIAGVLFIILLSVWPVPQEMIEEDAGGFRWDYLEHFLGYFALGTFYIMWRGDRKFFILGIELLLFAGIAFSLSLLLEYTQLFIPGRAFNIMDVLFNLAGVAGSILFIYYYFIRYYLRKRNSNAEA
jgi:VanZ family protein